MNPFGTSAGVIDAGDVTALALHLNRACNGPSKGRNEATEILDWFGIQATGRSITLGPTAMELPEYDLTDREQNRRALADPFGYLDRIDATVIPWSKVKELYR